MPIKIMRLPTPRELGNTSREFNGRCLDGNSYDRLVREDLHGLESRTGETKFLFLRDQFTPGVIRQTWDALRRLPYYGAGKSRRLALRGAEGHQIMMGWFSDTNGKRRYVGPTGSYPITYHFPLIPLMNAMSCLMARHLPHYWQEQVSVAQANGRCRIGTERWNPDGVSVFANNMLRTGRSEMVPEIFSTATVNKNVLCRSHADGNNANRLSGLMTFGDFVGGYLCFPRFRVAFDVQPGDVLFADTNWEQHGNIGPLVGERISLVSYLRDLREQARS